jgi:antitoxin YefM
MKTLPLAEAKAKLGTLVDDLRRHKRITITKHGRPAAVLMSYDELISLDATLEIMSDPDFYAEILRNRHALDRGHGRPYDLDELLAPVKAKNAAGVRRAPASSRPR